jgi:MSHA pilin protein MshD
MTSAVQRGSTLIELLFFIVVVSIGVVGILSVMNTTVRFSAEPMARKQAMVLAESILEEIVQKDYADRDASSAVPALRYDMDLVGDYDGQDESIFITAWPLSFPTDHVVNIVVEEDSWSVDSLLPTLSGDMDPLDVPVPVLLPVPVKKITVTVTSRGHTISLSGYRADY